MTQATAEIRFIDGGESAEAALLDRAFAALADPVRRSILEQLGERPLLVSEVAAAYPISLQAVSRHIQVLVRAGLVQQARTGRISRCSLDVGPMLAAAVWINRYAKYWQAQFDTLAAFLVPEPGAGAQPRRKARKVAPTRRRRTP
ncbi:MAG: winged helix-turn-helix transcriptional regulator [Alphaproteobacteria bacterium]|nr:winged helix-turn-helix transcriptional regulator [Alphaproteobacteria bacterium]